MTDEDKIKKLVEWLGTGSINIFGRPFSGKDTQAQKLAKLFGASVVGGGEILRSSENEGVKKVIGKGELAPTQDYLDIVLPYFNKATFKNKPLILSSVGRWHGEESGVIKALATTDHELKAVVLLSLDEKEVRRRKEIAKSLGDRGRRADDAHGVLDVRLREFRNKTLPVIEFYRKKGLLIEVDGSVAPDLVTAEILTRLAECANTTTNP